MYIRVKKLINDIQETIYEIQDDQMGSWGHEYNSSEFRPFSLSQYEEKYLKKLYPKIKEFMKAASEEELAELVKTYEYQEFKLILSTVPSVNTDYAANYAIVIIDNMFYLLKDKYYRCSIQYPFSQTVGHICKDVIDIYDFVNILASTKNNYYIGIDDFDYFIGKKNVNDTDIKSVIQIGFDKNRFKTVTSTQLNTTSQVIVNVDGNEVLLEKHKPYIITMNTQSYCEKIRLTPKGFEIVNVTASDILKDFSETMTMYPDIAILRNNDFLSSEIDNPTISCELMKKYWYDLKYKEDEWIKESREIKDYIIENKKDYNEENDDMPF